MRPSPNCAAQRSGPRACRRFLLTTRWSFCQSTPGSTNPLKAMTALAPTNCWTSGGFERQRGGPLSGEPQILFPLPEHKPCYSQRPWQKPGQTGPARDREPGRRRGGGSLEKKWEKGWFSQESCAKVAGLADRSRGERG